MTRPFYTLLVTSPLPDEGPGIAINKAKALAATFPEANAVWAEIAIYDDNTGKTDTGFDASLPLPGPHINLGVDRNLTWDEWSALEALGVTVSDHAAAPGLLGYDERVLAAPMMPEPEPEPEPQPEPDPYEFGFNEPEGGEGDAPEDPETEA